MWSADAKKEEAAFHKKLRAHHIRGEWFNAEAVLHEMQLLKARILTPEVLKRKVVSKRIVRLRASSAELRAWQALATQSDRPLSSWIREVCNAGLPARRSKATR